MFNVFDVIIRNFRIILNLNFNLRSKLDSHCICVFNQIIFVNTLLKSVNTIILVSLIYQNTHAEGFDSDNDMTALVGLLTYRMILLQNLNPIKH